VPRLASRSTKWPPLPCTLQLRSPAALTQRCARKNPVAASHRAHRAPRRHLRCVARRARRAGWANRSGAAIMSAARRRCSGRRADAALRCSSPRRVLRTAPDSAAHARRCTLLQLHRPHAPSCTSSAGGVRPWSQGQGASVEERRVRKGWWRHAPALAEWAAEAGRCCVLRLRCWCAGCATPPAVVSQLRSCRRRRDDTSPALLPVSPRLAAASPSRRHGTPVPALVRRRPAPSGAPRAIRARYRPTVVRPSAGAPSLGCAPVALVMAPLARLPDTAGDGMSGAPAPSVVARRCWHAACL
jgi:hypothetical protein